MKSFHNLKLGLKLLYLFLSTTFLVGLLGFLGVRNMGFIRGMADSLFNDHLIPVTYISNLNVNLINHNRRLCIIVLLYPGKDDYFQQRMAENETTARQLFEHCRQCNLSPEQKRLLEKTELFWGKYLNSSKEVFTLVKAGEKQKASDLLVGENRRLFQEVDNCLSKLVLEIQKEGGLAYRQSNSTYQRSRFYFLSLVLICVAVSLGVWIFTSLLVMIRSMDWKN